MRLRKCGRESGLVTSQQDVKRGNTYNMTADNVQINEDRLMLCRDTSSVRFPTRYRVYVVTIQDVLSLDLVQSEYPFDGLELRDIDY